MNNDHEKERMLTLSNVHFYFVLFFSYLTCPHISFTVSAFSDE